MPGRTSSIIKEALKEGNINKDEGFQGKADRSYCLGRA
jgi:hypothetical protein